MRRLLLACVAISILMIVAAKATTLAGSAGDEAAIRRVLEERNAAYNKHDAKAIAAVYAADVDLVTGTGRYLAGRAEVERYYAESFNGVDKNATVETENSKVRFLTGDVATLDIDGVVVGRTDGTARNHATWIFVKRNGKWTVVSVRAARVQ
jgi:uncharacterized protein (TIGR02246 family)